MEETIPQILKHIATINDEVGQVQVDVAVLKMQMGQIVWTMRAIFVAFIGVMFSQVWQLIWMKNSKNKKNLS